MADTELKEKQFAVNLGEIVEILDRQLAIEKDADGLYSIKLNLQFKCKKEFIEGGQDNKLPSHLGTLGVVATGTKGSDTLEPPVLQFYCDESKAIYMSIVDMKVPDGIKVDHSG